MTDILDIFKTRVVAHHDVLLDFYVPTWVEPKKSVLIATENGIIQHDGLSQISVPLLLRSEDELRAIIIQMLLKSVCVCQHTPEILGTVFSLETRVKGMHALLCNPSDSTVLGPYMPVKLIEHPDVPRGWVCGIPKPEYLGVLLRHTDCYNTDRYGVVRLDDNIVWTSITEQPLHPSLKNVVFWHQHRPLLERLNTDLCTTRCSVCQSTSWEELESSSDCRQICCKCCGCILTFKRSRVDTWRGNQFCLDSKK